MVKQTERKDRLTRHNFLSIPQVCPLFGMLPKRKRKLYPRRVVMDQLTNQPADQQMERPFYRVFISNWKWSLFGKEKEIVRFSQDSFLYSGPNRRRSPIECLCVHAFRSCLFPHWGLAQACPASQTQGPAQGHGEKNRAPHNQKFWALPLLMALL